MGNAQNEIDEVGQILDLTMAVQRAMAPVARKMTRQARQSWIGLATAELSRVLEDQIFLPAPSAHVEGVKSDPTAHSWREKDGVIYFSVTSDGTTGEDWITRLESQGLQV